MIRMLGEKTLISIISPENKTKGGIIIPDTAENVSDLAVVVSAGPLSNVSEGQMVCFYKYAGSEIEHGGKIYRILNNKDILGVME